LLLGKKLKDRLSVDKESEDSVPQNIEHGKNPNETIEKEENVEETKVQHFETGKFSVTTVISANNAECIHDVTAAE